MALLRNFEELDRIGKAGDWFFMKDDTHIGIQLQEGDHGLAILPIGDQSNAWKWDGNREAPTLTPSILHWGGGRGEPATWHGWLRAGKLETA